MAQGGHFFSRHRAIKRGFKPGVVDQQVLSLTIQDFGVQGLDLHVPVNQKVSPTIGANCEINVLNLKSLVIGWGSDNQCWNGVAPIIYLGADVL